MVQGIFSQGQRSQFVGAGVQFAFTSCYHLSPDMLSTCLTVWSVQASGGGAAHIMASGCVGDPPALQRAAAGRPEGQEPGRAQEAEPRRPAQAEPGQAALRLLQAALPAPLQLLRSAGATLVCRGCASEVASGAAQCLDSDFTATQVCHFEFLILGNLHCIPRIWKHQEQRILILLCWSLVLGSNGCQTKRLYRIWVVWVV